MLCFSTVLKYNYIKVYFVRCNFYNSWKVLKILFSATYLVSDSNCDTIYASRYNLLCSGGELTLKNWAWRHENMGGTEVRIYKVLTSPPDSCDWLPLCPGYCFVHLLFPTMTSYYITESVTYTRASKGSQQNLKMWRWASFFTLTIRFVCKRLRLLCHFAVLILKVYLTTLRRSACSVFVRKPEWKQILWRSRSRWDYNIKVSHKTQCLLYILPGLKRNYYYYYYYYYYYLQLSFHSVAVVLTLLQNKTNNNK